MENNKEMVTVAIPVYNVEKYVAEALTSILLQTFDNIEVLIIDDCGADDSMNVVHSIIDNYHGNKTVRIITHKENKELSEARNIAIKEAQGKYLFFMDSDDVITNDCIEKLYRIMDMENVDFVMSSFKRINEDGSILQELPLIHEDIIIKDNQRIVNNFFTNPDKYFMRCVWNKLFNLDFLRSKNISFIPKIYYEDLLFSTQTYMTAHSCAYISDITYYYRQREGSIFHISKGAFIKKNIKDLSYVLKTEKDYLYNFAYYEHFEDILLYFSIESYYNAKAYKNHNFNHINIKPYINDILYYPLSIREVLSLKRDKLKHLVFWVLGKLPYTITKYIL